MTLSPAPHLFICLHYKIQGRRGQWEECKNIMWDTRPDMAPNPSTQGSFTTHD